jgi:hypothetical protein
MAKASDPDRSAALWYSAGRRQAEAKVAPAKGEFPAAAAADAAPAIEVEVWLFGLLSAVSDERPVRLSLPAGSSVADVLAVLGERFGGAHLDQVKDGSGGLLASCRVFVDSAPCDDIAQPIAAEGAPATVELILLKSFEGG